MTPKPIRTINATPFTEASDCDVPLLTKSIECRNTTELQLSSGGGSGSSTSSEKSAVWKDQPFDCSGRMDASLDEKWKTSRGLSCFCGASPSGEKAVTLTSAAASIFFLSGCHIWNVRWKKFAQRGTGRVLCG